MSVFLIIGEIGLARLMSPRDMRESLETNFAEHDIIEGKTLLHFTGERPDLLDLSCTFHADFCNPEAVWDALKGLLRSHETFLVLTGAGALLGRFVLTGLDKTTTWADEDGTLYAFDCGLKIKEYAETSLLQGRVAAQQKTAVGLSGNSGRARVMSGGGNSTGTSGADIARMR